MKNTDLLSTRQHQHARWFCAIFFGLGLATGVTACSSEDDSSAVPVASLCTAASDTDVVIKGLEDLSTINTKTSISGDLIVCGTGDIESLELSNLERLTGNLIIVENTVLKTIALPALVSIGENPSTARAWWGLLIQDNAALETVTLPALRRVVGHVYVAKDAMLTEFDLPQLTELVGSLSFVEMPFTTLQGFNRLEAVGSGLAFSDNATLTSVGGFALLSAISNDLYLENNVELLDLSLPALQAIGRRVYVGTCPKFSTLDAPELLTVGSDLILDGTALVNLDTLPKLTVIGSDLTLSANTTLAQLLLPSLMVVANSLTLDTNAAITTLSATALQRVGSDLVLNKNNTLATLELPALLLVGGDLKVTSNSSLPTCTATALRDQVNTTDEADPYAIGGSVTIAGNLDPSSCQ